MEFGGREILIVLGVLVFLAIVLDVIRRVRQARYENIRMPRRKQPIFDDEVGIDEYGSELPSGGARVVRKRDESDVEQLSRSMKEVADATRPKLSIFNEPPLRAADLEQPAPAEVPAEPEPPAFEPAPSMTEEVKPKPTEAPVGGVVVLHLMSRKGQSLLGKPLLDALTHAELKHGTMNIFHRHSGESVSSEILYSVANSVNPGTFDVANMSRFNTPGISLFFAMDDLNEPAKAFEDMLATAQYLANQLNGVLCDENRSTLTAQTIEYYRERIATFVSHRLVGAQ